MRKTIHALFRLQKLLKPLAIAVALSPVASFSVAAYQLIDLGVDVLPTDINNNGTVVGYRQEGNARIAFRKTSGSAIEDLAGGIMANAVNDNEVITGTTATGAFLYDGAVRDIGDGYYDGDINALDQVAGSKTGNNPYRSSPLPVNPARYDLNAHGQKWQVLDVARVYSRGTRKGVYADIYTLFGINDAAYSVGRKYRYGLVGSAAILVTPQFKDVTFLPIPSGGTALAINNSNRVVGTNGEAHAHAYLYDFNDDTYIDLGTLHGGLRSSAADINDNDQVVGSAWLSKVDTSLNDPTMYHAFQWDSVNGMVDLNELSGAQNWLLTAATAINGHGDIVGTGIVNGQVHGFLLASDAP